MKRRKWLLSLFVVTIIVSIFIFIKYEGYNGMFDSFNKEQIESDTTVEVIEFLPIIEPIVKISPDTVIIYRVIIGSFKIYNNAVKYTEKYDFSDILSITSNGFYRVSKDYYFNIEDAIKDRNNMGGNIWVLKDKLLLEI